MPATNWNTTTPTVQISEFARIWTNTGEARTDL